MKYERTPVVKVFAGRILYQIRALKDFGAVKAGDLGGWIENETNLDQEGDAWVYQGAWVFGEARISGNARITGNVRVFGNVQVSDGAWIFG